MWDLHGTIWATPYWIHADPGCTPHTGGPYGTHICMFAGYLSKDGGLDSRSRVAHVVRVADWCNGIKGLSPISIGIFPSFFYFKMVAKW